mmetsp:Transcript_6931/g.14341  ORF Transcript_6931/g.14341 Transcript_6931/m.14341 type:complete len:213 (-) Transcript_6931:266-904(-)
MPVPLSPTQKSLPVTPFRREQNPSMTSGATNALHLGGRLRRRLRSSRLPHPRQGRALLLLLLVVGAVHAVAGAAAAAHGHEEHDHRYTDQEEEVCREGQGHYHVVIRTAPQHGSSNGNQDNNGRQEHTGDWWHSGSEGQACELGVENICTCTCEPAYHKAHRQLLLLVLDVWHLDNHQPGRNHDGHDDANLYWHVDRLDKDALLRVCPECAC